MDENPASCAHPSCGAGAAPALQALVPGLRTGSWRRERDLFARRGRRQKNEVLTTLPARPPAMSANPINKNNLARHTARASPKSSCPCTRSLSMRLMTIIPKREQMPGSQSTKETWTGGGICGSSYGEWACAERIAASRNVQFARANCSGEPSHRLARRMKE